MMKSFKNLMLIFLKKTLFSRIKAVALLTFLIVCSDMAKAQTSEVEWMEGSWGVRLIIRGGKDLDTFVANGYDYVEAARQIVRDYPTIGHVITNLTNNANSSLYTLRQNNYIDIANEIHPDFVPSLENEQIIFDVIQVFRDAGIKVILYINHWPNMGEGSAAQIAGWENFTATRNLGNYAAFNLLMRGFLERLDGLVDGYWIDKIGGADSSIPAKSIFIDQITETNPNAALGVNWKKDYFPGIKVDSDGPNERDPDDYQIIKYEANDTWSQFTAGHVTSIGGQRAPSNSWGYDEYTVPDMMEDNLSINPETGKVFVKHMFAPIRRRWSLNDEPLMYDKHQAYRFVKRIVDAGAGITFSTTITAGGLAMPDEAEVLKHVNTQLEANADYIPYVRPEGAYLVGETAPNYHQFIDFQKVDDKKVGDSDFFPFAYASSGDPVTLTSSNLSVATIVNNQISIQGEGTTDITASQSGNSTFAAATSKTQSLTVYPEGTILNNIALNGTATQSSDLSGGGGEASLAIDGDTNGVYANSSVTSTSLEIDPWWQVDLESDYSIDTIKIFGRTDVCCNTELSNFTVTITDNDGNVTYTETFTSYPDPSTTINTGGVIGNIVKVQQHSDSVAISLNLAEVQVSGNEINVSQTIFFPEIFDKEVGGANFSPKAMASSGLAVSYTSSNTDVAIIVNNDIQIVAEGTTNITATQLGNATFAAATPEVRQLNVIVPDEGGANENGEIFPEADSYTWDKFPDNNLNNNRLFIQQGAADSSRETFLKFNVSTLPESIDNITLQLTLDTEATAAIVCEAFLVTDDSWIETGITWNNIPASDVSLGTATHNGNVIEFDVTNSVLTESTGDGTFSIKIVSTELGGTNYKIYSKETASSDLEKPKLTITETSLSNDSITLNDDTELSVYPNPMNDDFVIDLSSWQEASYTITNYTGQTLLSGVIKKGTASVDLSDLSSGFYVVRVSRDYETVSKKIIKK